MGDTICASSSPVNTRSRCPKRSRESTYAAGAPTSIVTSVARTATCALFHRYHGTCVCVTTNP